MSHCRHQLTDSHRAILLKIVYVALLLFIVLTFSLNVLSLFCKHEFENGYCHKCGYICDHYHWNDGVCTYCGKACKHDWHEGICWICGMEEIDANEEN